MLPTASANQDRPTAEKLPVRTLIHIAMASHSELSPKSDMTWPDR